MGPSAVHGDRSDLQSPPSVGGDRQFSQRVDGRARAQGAVVSDLQIPGDIHHRFGGDGAAVLVVEVNGGPDGVGARVQQHE